MGAYTVAPDKREFQENIFRLFLQKHVVTY